MCVGSACDSRRHGRRRVVTRCARDAPASRRRATPRAGTPRRRYTRGKTRRPKLHGSVPAARIHYAHTPHTCRAKRPNIAPVAARRGPLRRSFPISFFVSGVKFLGSRSRNRLASGVVFLLGSGFFFYALLPTLTNRLHTYSFRRVSMTAMTRL